MAERFCGRCRASLADYRKDAKWCSDRCRVAAYKARKADAERSPRRKKRSDAIPTADGAIEFKDADESLDGRGSPRKPPDNVQRFHLFPHLLSGKVGPTDFARRWTEHSGQPCTSQAASRWKAWGLQNASKIKAQGDWTREPEVEEALDDFVKFSDRYFSDNPKIGLMPEHHRRWAEAITDTMDSGGRLLLLAPQRHGKTSMLIKYVMWSLCRDPDLCIIWVGKSENKAAEATGLIQQFFQDMPNLVEDVWGPGIDIKPPHRSGLSWTPSDMTLSVRTVTRKSPSLKAMGIDSNILGSDADRIIVDDPVERGGHKGMTQPGNRDNAYERLVTDVNSRKTRNTGFAYITSRMHVDDPPGRILKRFPHMWKIIVERAHDLNCTRPDDEHDDSSPCLLWPDAPDLGYDFLMEQKEVNPAHFERNYQNNPRDDAEVLVRVEDIQDKTLPEVIEGRWPDGWQLIAGFDPATSKPNASVLWAYSTQLSLAVPIDARFWPTAQGGFAEALEKWWAQYGVRHWVIETNMKGFLTHSDVKVVKEKYTIRIDEHGTYHNKVDPTGGVASMLGTIASEGGPIHFPTHPRVNVDKLVTQILEWDSESAKSKHADDDLVMAMWFPWWSFLRSRMEQRSSAAEMVVDYDVVRGL